MRLDKLTVKLQEALQEAISFATESGHQQVEPEHLIYTLLRQQDSIMAGVLDKLNIQTFSDPLSVKMLSGVLKDGSKVVVDLDGNKDLVFR